MGVSEYWVVDVRKSQIYAFEMIDRGSKRIDTSLVLSGLSIETITTALNLSKEQDQSQIGKWLMSEFQT
jgi:SOS response regulatory protein OraA/RecX